MMSTSDIHIQEHQDDRPRVKTAPQSSKISVPFSYKASDDGTDENLLVLLHGLGDSHVPFFKLGCSLKLPQTAVLALRAPEQIPYLYEQAFQWYESFDPLGELIQHPNPTSALDLLSKITDHIVNDCNWPPGRIHFFGFAQGGSVVTEFGIRWFKSHLDSASRDFGSITSIAGPLLSYPTLEKLSSTPVLLVHRKPPAEPSVPKDAVSALKKAYQRVQDKLLEGKKSGMPASREEWEPIMRFWSENLGKRQMSGLYEVLSGAAPVPT